MSENPADDLLPEILSEYRLSARVFATPSLCGSWRLNTSGMHAAGFHLIAHGHCWLHLDERRAQPLAAGDLLFITGDVRHVLSAEAELDGEDTRLVDEGGGPRTEIICGQVGFGDPGGEALLRGLPRVVLLCGGPEHRDARLERLARLMVEEARLGGAGRQVVLDRLSDVLFIHVLRDVMSREGVDAGLLAALRSPHLRRALNAIHRQCERAWTLEELAVIAGLSRSAFARRFSHVMGVSPMNYLARRRMRHAEALLQDRSRSVADVAAQLGYATEAAFRRAFKRLRGIGPGQVRRLASRHDAATPSTADPS